MVFLFARLMHQIKPTDGEVARARVHAATIRARLTKTFNLKKFVFIGSHSRDTAVRGHSDLDLLAVFSRKDARWGEEFVKSTTFLRWIREDLEQRYQQTSIRGDGQALVIGFAAGQQSVDVVPAIFVGPGPDNWPLYSIPDGIGGWLQTSPEKHSKYLLEENERAKGKLKRVIQMVKYWRECRSPRVPLESFHLELLLASEGVCAGVKSYARCMFDAFYLLASRQGRGLQDPLGISGVVPACKTEAQRQVLQAAFAYARDHAWAALQAEDKSNRREAARQWGIVFNGYFPQLPR